MRQRKLSRRGFLETALAGGAAGVANLTITKDLFAQASGPIVIGHHCDLTGVISSWGFWHDKCAKAAVDLINQGGGIAGRKLELATEDTESNPASGARKLRNLVQRTNAEFIVGSVHSGVMLAAIPIATELKTIYFSTGEATEATGAKGTRFSFRTGTDTYSIAAASLPWCVENFGKVWTIIYADYAWGQSTTQESKVYIERAAEGVYFFENFPRQIKAKDDSFHKEFNRLVGIDDVDAREIGGKRVMDKSHGWQAWEDLFALKQAIEASGYKTRKDVEGVIQALEGMQMKNSLAHPQGDKMIRKEDHDGIIDC